MKKSQIKQLLFERFETRLNEIVDLKKQLQEHLENETQDFVKEFGDVAKEALAAKGLWAAKPEKPKSAAEKKTTKAKPEKKTRRHRNKSGVNVSKILREKLPTAVSALGTKGTFTAREAFDYLVSGQLVPDAVKISHVSLQLGQDKKTLGLKVQKRMAGSPIPKPTNFFSLVKKTRAKKQ